MDGFAQLLQTTLDCTAEGVLVIRDRNIVLINAALEEFIQQENKTFRREDVIGQNAEALPILIDGLKASLDEAVVLIRGSSKKRQTTSTYCTVGQIIRQVCILWI
jgi:hypothetical protein